MSPVVIFAIINANKMVIDWLSNHIRVMDKNRRICKNLKKNDTNNCRLKLALGNLGLLYH